MEMQLNMEIVDNMDDSSEEEDEDIRVAALDLLPNGRRDIKHAAVNMMMEMRSVPAMTRIGVRRAMEGAELVVDLNNLSLKEDVTEFLNRTGQINNQRAQSLLRKFDNIKPFQGIKSNDGQISGIKKYYNYVQPETVFLEDRMDQRLVGDGGGYGLVPVPDSYQYASVIEFLKLITKKRSVIEYVRNRQPSEDGILHGYIDADEFKEHPFFQRHPDAFQLVLYGDGVDPARMAGPKSGLHEIYLFCIIVLNLPPELLYSGDSIFPIVMANAMDCKETFSAVLSRFMQELRRLEAGERVFVNGAFTTLRATLVGVKADAKAVHEILGFLACGARHFCPQCMISREELHLGHVAVGEIRTPALSDMQLERVARNPAYSTECGLRYRTCLHDSAYFRAENNMMFDLMHDGPEGLIIMLIRLCLKRWVCTENLFSVEELNARIAAYDYGTQNSKDRPSPNFTRESLENANTVHKQKMNAAQILVLFRALPFLLDGIGPNGIDEDDEYLQYLLLFSEIFQIGSAPNVSRSIIPYLRRQVEIFRVSWYRLFPDVLPINKFHQFLHLCENILRKGPQRQYWCFKEEGKNCPLKRHIVICNNFKNPQKTAMEQAQIRVAKVWGTRSDDIEDRRKFVGRHNEFVHASPVRLQLQALGFEDNDEISVCRSVTVWGYVYRLREFVLYSKSTDNANGLPRFGELISIICPEDSDHTWFAVEPYTTLGLVEKFNAYLVTRQENAPTHLIDRKDLPTHPALSRWRDYSSANIYLSLKYKVF